MDDLKSIIGKVATGATLSRDEAASAFDSMMSGEATPSQMGGLLMALRVRGETVDEITGAVSAMRAKMLRVSAPVDAIDVVGTGGDGSGSVNVSTCASFIVAGVGVPVAKHGNRALSSRSGAADVLSALGVKIDLKPEQVGRVGTDALKGGDAEANAIALHSVLDGMPSPYRDVALLNAAAALVVAGRAKTLKEGVALGLKSLDTGAAAGKLKRLIAVSNS